MAASKYVKASWGLPWARLTWALVMSWETGVSAGMSNATEVERQMAPMARSDGRRIMVHGVCAVQCVCVGRVARNVKKKERNKRWWWWSCFRGLESGLQLIKPDGSSISPHSCNDGNSRKHVTE